MDDNAFPVSDGIDVMFLSHSLVVSSDYQNMLSVTALVFAMK